MAADTEREAAQREAAERATRRQFFRLFGRQTVSNAGSVLAGVAALRATGQEALNELLTTDPARPAATTDRPIRPTTAADAAEPGLPSADALRSPYRLEGDELLILDQRELPGRVAYLSCRDASEVAAAIRLGALGGGPVLAQVAAYTLLLAAQSATDRSAYARRAALGAAADTLRACRPIHRGIAAAVEGVLAAAEASESADEPLAAVRAAADTIAMEAALDHARLGQLAAAHLAQIEPRNPTPAGRRLALLMVGDLGPLAGGMVGPGFALIQSLTTLGRPVHAWLTDGAPLMEGRRASWQLEQLDVPNTTVPDAGTGWLLAHRRIDAVLLRAEWIIAGGDAIAPLGSVAAARQARADEVPVYAVAPTALLDARADASPLPAELRVPSREAGGARLDPAADVLPSELLDGIFTEEGLLAPPFESSIAAAVESRAARRVSDASTQGAA